MRRRNFPPSSSFLRTAGKELRDELFSQDFERGDFFSLSLKCFLTFLKELSRHNLDEKLVHFHQLLWHFFSLKKMHATFMSAIFFLRSQCRTCTRYCPEKETRPDSRLCVACSKMAIVIVEGFLFGVTQHQGRFVDCHTQPPTLACEMEVQSEYAHIAYTFGADLLAQSVLINKISASELLVGYACESKECA